MIGGVKVNVRFPDGNEYPYYFSRVPCVGEHVQSKRKTWIVYYVLHHAQESNIKDVPATIHVGE